MSGLSIAIIARNEEANIRACLESAAWADEIVLVDACSEDATVTIAREFTDRIFVRKWEGFAAQKEFSLQQCTSPWIFSLDADERIRPELREAMQAVIADPHALAGYRVGRRSWFLGCWIRHGGWYPGYQLRLFRREAVRMIRRRVHEGFEVEGPIGTLTGDLDHFSHPTIAGSLDKMNRYSTLEAFDRLERKRVHAIDFITHPFAAFLRKYIAQGGFRDGVHGLVLAWVTAVVKLALYMKIRELQQRPAGETAEAAGGELMRLFDEYQAELEQYQPAAGKQGRKPDLKAFVFQPAAAFWRHYVRRGRPGGVPGLMQALLAAVYATARELANWEAGLSNTSS
ncbi:MAG TPA: glycosyltransferase family 2 protein [bacterium]|nr:glycosyltransferase family 2 protein [bacterium]